MTSNNTRSVSHSRSGQWHCCNVTRQYLFFLLHHDPVSYWPWAHPASCLMGAGLSRPGREADHSLPSSVEGINTWGCISTPSKATQRLGVLSPILNSRSDLSIINGALLYKQLIRPVMDYACPVWRSAARSHVRKLRCNPSVFALQATQLGTLVTGKSGFLLSPTTSGH
jgi:hypothetical protein